MSKFVQGKYTPQNPQKYIGDVNNIIYRSSWERKFMGWCDRNPSVLQWGSEEFSIPYYSQIDQKIRRYFPDFILLIKNKAGEKEKIVVEVKPYKETVPPIKPKRKTKKSQAKYIQEHITFQRNQDKWKAAKKFVEKHNMKFLIADEYGLNIKKRSKPDGK